MSSPVITIFVRHGGDCKQTDESWKRCTCRKHFRWSVGQGKTLKQFRQAAGTRSWSEAEELKRKLEDQLSGKSVEAPETPRNIQDCVDLFLKDKAVQGFTAANTRAYRHQLGELAKYFSSVQIFTVQGITRESLTGYCATWPNLYPSAATRYRVRARHNSFFRFCHDCKWLDRTPKMPKMAEPDSETMPLTAEEFDRLLASISRLKDATDRARVRGLFLLQRWSGLAIRDALTLPKSALQHTGSFYRVVTSRVKTNTPVSVPLHPGIAAELLSIPNDNPSFFFWDGKRDEYLFTVSFGQMVKRVFTEAKLDEGHMKSHRLRDTFAVELLSKGVPMEEVSKLLGHKSIRTTERHYAKWVKGRQDRLDNLVMNTWAA